jgi:hypothetical protein
VGDGVRGCVTGFSGAAAAAADVYWKGGFPRRALALLDDAIELLRGDHELAALSEKIRTETGIDLSRWHRLEITADLDGFSGAGGFKVDGDALVGTLDLSGTTIELKKIVQFLTCDEPLGTHYTVEAVIEPSDSDFATGVVFGNSEKKGLQAVVLGPGGGVSTFMYDEEKGPDFTPPKGHAKDGAVRLGAEIRLSAGGTGGTVTYLLEGKEVGSEPIDPQGFRPKAGVFGFLSHGRIHDLRIRR